jgi:hypothetical protein
MIQLVDAEPGLFLVEIRKPLHDSRGDLLSAEGVHRNLVERLLIITLKKPGTQNVRKSLVQKYALVESMEFFPADFLLFAG